jgi:D-alanyl-D-alanine carboxypeptidase (penicillin-binding protein 5/6)
LQQWIPEMAGGELRREQCVAEPEAADPSGYDDATVSTAADQVRIVDWALRLPVFASVVATPSATLPVAGTVHNTDTLLGYDGFVGVKTGSDDAAGGCFAFRKICWVDGRRTTITGGRVGPARPRPDRGGSRGRRRHGRPHRR